MRLLKFLVLSAAFLPALIPIAASAAAPDQRILGAQVLLDRLGFGPGVIDGAGGMSFAKALRGWQEAKGLPLTGKLDAATVKSFAPFRAMPTVIDVKLTPAILEGPFVGPLPAKESDQAKMKSLGYADAMEKLAERYHTTRATLIALNSPQTRVRPGATIKVPNVIPPKQAFAQDINPAWRKTLWTLNVGSDQPEVAKVVVDKSDGVLRGYDGAGKLVAQFPATMGSEYDPLPIGTWKIQGRSYNPPFHYNPKLFWDADSTDKKALLPPGPNGPVGVVWIDLDKKHYGIHGTPRPETIGRTESHGCIRLTNWDAARLALMVKPGTPAVFQE
ncbi:L,D-transpeptidase family protein [Rhizorhabdus dicambivorans]|uniref:Murein L,D-transpeptidase n=1 Tax=Rhizorhabdus dicambivorans TaxID=1850238 RepID=A0A2A4FUU3_9SPHN|nr:L,D-transpeptidase family protein [Rhizorhabdus dicambivorans]ATE66925.1 murein L,D-transpeptidase [Rhizorhabdus dicambivorans]PCE42205.1 murein L,D-transpeptidase [Rhizorhabdus dicambivorans]